MKTSIEVRLQGTKAQYYVLKMFREGQEFPTVHTSKSLAYLQKIRKNRS